MGIIEFIGVILFLLTHVMYLVVVVMVVTSPLMLLLYFKNLRFKAFVARNKKTIALTAALPFAVIVLSNFWGPYGKTLFKTKISWEQAEKRIDQCRVTRIINLERYQVSGQTRERVLIKRGLMDYYIDTEDIPKFALNQAIDRNRDNCRNPVEVIASDYFFPID